MAEKTTISLVVGDTITLTGLATGGSEEYTYSYIVYNKDTGKWSRLANNITSDTYTWEAKSKGNRVFFVEVMDSKGKVIRSKPIETNTVDKLRVRAKASATTVAVGEEITLTCLATGGKGEYVYSYLVHNKKSDKWSKIADGVDTDTFVWAAKNSGDRIFYVDVKDKSGKVVRSNKLAVSVKKNV